MPYRYVLSVKDNGKQNGVVNSYYYWYIHVYIINYSIKSAAKSPQLLIVLHGLFANISYFDCCNLKFCPKYELFLFIWFSYFALNSKTANCSWCLFLWHLTACSTMVILNRSFFLIFLLQLPGHVVWSNKRRNPVRMRDKSSLDFLLCTSCPVC